MVDLLYLIVWKVFLAVFGHLKRDLLFLSNQAVWLTAPLFCTSQILLRISEYAEFRARHLAVVNCVLISEIANQAPC